MSVNIQGCYLIKKLERKMRCGIIIHMNERKKSRETILVVDDVEMNRDILKSIFNDFNIIEAVNGKDALIKLREFKSDISVVLLDIVMPIMDGLEVLTEKQIDNEINEIPVIITSASDEMENSLKAIELGAMDYVTKPVEPALVKLRVASALQKRDNERLRVQNQCVLLQREEELRHQAELLYIAEHDSLTGLYNKTAFYRKVEQLIEENEKTEYVIISFDVERFKMINELFGFDEGDKLLCYIAEKIKSNAMVGELFCRVDGDNFALCTPNSPMRISKILQTITKEMKLYDILFEVKIVLGCYVVDNKKLSVKSMLERALMAKRSIKGKYQENCAFYDDKLRQELLREQRIVSQMESALQNEQFKMYLQGQYNYKTGELIGAEALVRWIHPLKGIVPPNAFIPIFERNGFIRKLDEYMWEQACIHIKKWINKYNRELPLYISVNISRMNIYNEMLCDVIYGFIQKYDIPPQYLKLEITESAYVQNPKQLIDVVENLRGHGLIVEIDDFGSGYSSLNTLKDLRVDVLKLDMKFLSETDNTIRRDSILFHVINMAKSLGLSVIAEGVETKEQADSLLSMGCELMQGYYFARPVPVNEFESLIGGYTK